MKPFRERNPIAVAIVSAVVLAVLVVGAINFARLPLVNATATYRADFVNAGGLATGDSVTVAGVHVGTVTGMRLAGTVVEVTFTVADGTALGKRTGAAARVLNPLGTEYLALLPAGGGRLGTGRPIPVQRTQVPYTLVSDLNQLATQTQQINVSQLEQAIEDTSQALSGTSSQQTAQALTSLATVAKAIGSQQSQLASLLDNAQQLAAVLNAHTSQLKDLLAQATTFLGVLQQRSSDITTLLRATQQLASQVDQLLSTNGANLTPLLADLQTVTGVLANDRSALQAAVPLFASFASYAANVTGQGPFGEFVLPTLLIPDNIIAQCAAPGMINNVTGCNA
jgi:phospholipid/cholesterol/gamma-HCH transport system substrate-binding protein